MNVKILHVLLLLLGILTIGNRYANIGNTAAQIEISRNNESSEKTCVQIVEILEKEDLIVATLAPSKILELWSEKCFFHSNFSIDRLTYYFATLLV